MELHLQFSQHEIRITLCSPRREKKKKEKKEEFIVFGMYNFFQEQLQWTGGDMSLMSVDLRVKGQI